MKNKKMRRIVIVFFIIFTLHLWSSLFIEIKNTELLIKIQKGQKQIERLKEENEKLLQEITQLQNYERVSAIAEENGLHENTNFVYVIR